MRMQMAENFIIRSKIVGLTDDPTTRVASAKRKSIRVPCTRRRNPSHNNKNNRTVLLRLLCREKPMLRMRRTQIRVPSLSSTLLHMPLALRQQPIMGKRHFQM
jgi:hypothetical protein